MSAPAQRPPERPGVLVQTSELISEILVFGLSVLSGLVVALLAAVLGLLASDSLLLGAVMLGAAGLSYLAIERAAGWSSAPLADARKGVGASLLIALGGVVIALVGSTLLSMLQELLGVAVNEQASIMEIVDQGSNFDHAMLAVSAVLLAPLTEELLFRRMLFRRLRQRTETSLAWLIPAFAFALFHGNLSGLVIYVWLGLVFAAAYLLSGRWAVAVAVHAGHNGFALAMLLWGP